MLRTRNLLVAGLAVLALAPVLPAQAALSFQKPPQAMTRPGLQ